MKNKFLFAIIFVILGFISLQIPINTLEGARVKFTLFDIFAPIVGVFLGLPFGIATVFLVQLANFVVNGFTGVNTSSPLAWIATLRFLPLIAGVWYFANVTKLSLRGSRAERGRRSNLILIIPALSILTFNLHPIGRSVWFYSLFWLIPFLVWPLRERSLVARSLGSTFAAHSIGGAFWIWAFNLPATVWISLIPVVALERSIFALGISAYYIFMNNVLGYLSSKKLLSKNISFDKKYLLTARSSK